MNQGQGRILDELAKLMTDGVELAQGARREALTFFRARVEEILAGMDIVGREEFEVAVEMASRAREENEALRKEVEELKKLIGELRKDKKRSSSPDKKPG